MRPKKIYINERYLEENDGRCVISAKIHPAKPHSQTIHYAEYTDLSQVWHDTDKELPELIGGNDYTMSSDILVVELRCSDGSTIFPWPVMYAEDKGDAEGYFFCSRRVNVAPEIYAKEDVVRWARLFDFRVKK